MEDTRTQKPPVLFFSSVHFTFRIPPFENQNSHTSAHVYIHVYMHMLKKNATDTTPFPFKMLVTSFCISCWKRRFCFLLFVPDFGMTRSSDWLFFIMQYLEKRTCLAQKDFPCVEKAGKNAFQHICETELLLNSY